MPDLWIWKPNISGAYSVGSAYKWLMGRGLPANSKGEWGWLWKLKLPANIQFFLWQVCHRAVPTRSILKRRGVAREEECPLCLTEQETIIHCLFSCPRAVQLWNSCGLGDVSPPIGENALLGWFRHHCSLNGVMIPCVVWFLWISRNKKVFNNQDVQATTMLAQVLSMVKHIGSAFGLNQHIAHRLPKEVRWDKPDEGVCSLNVDGSAMTNPGLAGFGGIVRDSNGKFVRGFYGSVGWSDILHAEVMAIFHGLRMCWEVGIRKLVCCSDSMLAVSLIQQGVSPLHRHANELAIIHDLLRRDWEITINHTYREGNFCADFLAKMGARCNEPLVNLDAAPPGLGPLLVADAMGVSFRRE